MGNLQPPQAPSSRTIDGSGGRMSSWVYAIAIVGILSLIVVQAIDIIGRQTISPEICLAWIQANTKQSFMQTLAFFADFHELWYRPLTQQVLNHYFFTVVDAHNYRLIKAISFGVILANGYVATLLARRVFAANLIESIVTFALIVTHPLYYEIAYEGSGIVDPIFFLGLNGFLICLLLLLQAANPKLGHTVRLTAARSVALAVACCLLLLVIVTSQERGLAVFPMAALLYLYFLWPVRSKWRSWPTLSASGVMLFCLVVLSLYVVLIAVHKPHMTGDHYRDDFELGFVLNNVFKGVELPLRLLLVNTGFSYDAHNTLEFNLFAIPLVASLLSYVVSVCRGSDDVEKQRLAVVAMLYVCALVIPVLYGAAAWHFYTAAVYMSIATGRSIWYWLRLANLRLRAGLLLIFFAGLTLATVSGIAEELRTGNFPIYMSLVPRALEDKVLNNIPYVPQVVYYDTGSFNGFTWPFGGGGYLFRYLYRDPRIIEVGLVHGKVVNSDADQFWCTRARALFPAIPKRAEILGHDSAGNAIYGVRVSTPTAGFASEWTLPQFGNTPFGNFYAGWNGNKTSGWTRIGGGASPTMQSALASASAAPAHALSFGFDVEHQNWHVISAKPCQG